MIRVAMLSRWHVHANDYAREAIAHPDIVIQAVWDEDKERGIQWADELKVDFEESLTTLLNRSDIDAVIVDTPTSMHTEVIVEAASAKKHIFSEKVLALTEEDCQLIFTAVKDNQVSLMLSLPRLNDPSYLYAQDALDQGLLGDLTSIRCRLEHGGALASEAHPTGWLPAHFYDLEQCGGGALIDLGAHPIYLTNRLAGSATALYCQMNSITNREVDDHSTVLVQYASGATGVIEAGFVADKSPFILELHGTKGSILVEDRSVRIRSSQLNHSEWHTPQLPDQEASAMEQWVNHIQTGEPARITEKDMLDLTRINHAARQSVEQGRRISL